MTSKVTTAYVGTISPHTRNYHVRVHQQHGSELSTTALPQQLALRNHSPTGFCWGYMGSGPSQLALAILVHHLRSKERALNLYQSFKEQVIARLPKNDNFVLQGTDVAAWVHKQLAVAK